MEMSFDFDSPKQPPRWALEFDEEPHTQIHFESCESYSPPSHGPLRQAVPCMGIQLAVFCCMLNFILPGVGTIISAFTVWGDETCYESHKSHNRVFCLNMASGLLQILLTPVIFGYLWSVVWGILFVELSRKWYISNITDRAVCFDCCLCSKI